MGRPRKSYQLIEERYEEIKAEVIAGKRIPHTAFYYKDPYTDKHTPVDYNKDTTIVYCIGYYTPGWFCNIKKGRRGIPLNAIVYLGEILGCNWKYLAGLSNDKEAVEFAI